MSFALVKWVLEDRTSIIPSLWTRQCYTTVKQLTPGRSLQLEEEIQQTRSNHPCYVRFKGDTAR